MTTLADRKGTVKGCEILSSGMTVKGPNAGPFLLANGP